MIFCALMFLMLVLALLLQLFLPVISFQSSNFTYEAHVYLPWSFFYVLALAVPYPVMLFFSITLGFLWDAHWMTPRGGEADPAFGLSAVFFFLLGSFVHGVRPLFRRGHWVLPILMVGLAVLIQLICEYLLMNFQRGRFEFSGEIWFKMVLTSFTAMVLAPLLLLIISKVAKKSGYQLEFEQFMFRRVYGHQI